MSKKFDIISFILMTILIIMLFMVVFNYFTRSSTIMADLDSSTNIQTPSNIIYSGDKNSVIISNDGVSGNTSNNDGQSIINIGATNVENPIKISQNDSGESVIVSESVEQVNKNDESTTPNIPNTSNPSNPTETTPVIMTSADDISNKEKKEVLKELDQTLMELFEIVDSVQTIDETRLINEEGEVQE